jgi:hypothetical protein
MNEKWREVDRSWSLGFLTFSVSITLLGISITLLQRCCVALVCVLVLRLSCSCVALVVFLCCACCIAVLRIVPAFSLGCASQNRGLQGASSTVWRTYISSKCSLNLKDCFCNLIT